MKSIVLLSSGFDSTVAFKEAYDRCDEVLCVTFDDGQKAGKKEIEFAKAICKRGGTYHHRASLVQEVSRSAHRGRRNAEDIKL